MDRWLARCAKLKGPKGLTLVASTVMIDLLIENRGHYFKYLEDKYGIELDLVENEAAPMSEYNFFKTETGEEITHNYQFRYK
jgi:galactitol-specific phosphotransferase system IIC component